VKQLTTWALVLLLAIPALGLQMTAEQQARNIRTGKEIEITLDRGELLRGRMGRYRAWSS